MADKLLNRHPNVFGDLPEKERRNVSAGMEWNGRSPAIGVAVLPMRAALADFDKPQAFQNAADLARLKHREIAHAVAT